MNSIKELSQETFDEALRQMNGGFVPLGTSQHTIVTDIIGFVPVGEASDGQPIEPSAEYQETTFHLAMLAENSEEAAKLLEIMRKNLAEIHPSVEAGNDTELSGLLSAFFMVGFKAGWNSRNLHGAK